MPPAGWEPDGSVPAPGLPAGDAPDGLLLGLGVELPALPEDAGNGDEVPAPDELLPAGEPLLVDPGGRVSAELLQAASARPANSENSSAGFCMLVKLDQPAVKSLTIIYRPGCQPVSVWSAPGGFSSGFRDAGPGGFNCAYVALH
jgi:hypothetical protein